MNNKALLVGINAYPNPSNHLRGCINDIVDMEYFIATKNKVYPKENIRTLTDSRATKKGILNALNWLLLGASAGDQILFQYSGHGAQIPSHSTAIEKDGLDEIICPYDFNGEDAAETAISDKEFAKLFAKIPKGVHFVCGLVEYLNFTSSKILKYKITLTYLTKTLILICQTSFIRDQAIIFYIFLWQYPM